jgi:hypothetical protein
VHAARSLSRSPSPPPPSFTQSPSPPRSLVFDGRTSPHSPLLVVPRTTLHMKENFVPQSGAESSLAGLLLPAAGGDRTWAARTVSGPMLMRGDIFAAAPVEGPVTDHRTSVYYLLCLQELSSSRHPVVVDAVRVVGGCFCGEVCVVDFLQVLRSRHCPPRCRASAAHFLIAYCVGLSVGWISFVGLSVGWISVDILIIFKILFFFFFKHLFIKFSILIIINFYLFFMCVFILLVIRSTSVTCFIW